MRCVDGSCGPQILIESSWTEARSPSGALGVVPSAARRTPCRRQAADVRAGVAGTPQSESMSTPSWQPRWSSLESSVRVSACPAQRRRCARGPRPFAVCISPSLLSLLRVPSRPLSYHHLVCFPPEIQLSRSSSPAIDRCVHDPPRPWPLCASTIFTTRPRHVRPRPHRRPRRRGEYAAAADPAQRAEKAQTPAAATAAPETVGLGPMPEARACEPAVLCVPGMPVSERAVRGVPVVPGRVRRGCRAGRGRAAAAELADAAERRAEDAARAHRAARSRRGQGRIRYVVSGRGGPRAEGM
ncbi:hypothetical protein C8Q78DRAFT_790763 [Trametes maxima]|nr:hypothetical protein C8Q78DRAFT_790763 [Trametes maxima]